MGHGHAARSVCLAIGVLVLCTAVGGCAGSGRVTVVPIDLRKISSKTPLVRELPAHRCYFWSDVDERLCVAMESENISLIGDYGKRSMDLSFVLDGLPAASARNFKVTNQSLRMVARMGVGHSRWASLTGVVAVWREGKDRLRGRFRILAKQQDFFIALGWSGNRRALLVGEFSAVRHPSAGRRILERTEAGGMERKRATTPRQPPSPAKQ